MAVGGRGTEVSQCSSGRKPGGEGPRGEARSVALGCCKYVWGAALNSWILFLLTWWKGSGSRYPRFSWLLGCHMPEADRGREQSRTCA